MHYDKQKIYLRNKSYCSQDSFISQNPSFSRNWFSLEFQCFTPVSTVRVQTTRPAAVYKGRLILLEFDAKLKVRYLIGTFAVILKDRLDNFWSNFWKTVVSSFFRISLGLATSSTFALGKAGQQTARKSMAIPYAWRIFGQTLYSCFVYGLLSYSKCVPSSQPTVALDSLYLYRFNN